MDAADLLSVVAGIAMLCAAALTFRLLVPRRRPAPAISSGRPSTSHMPVTESPPTVPPITPSVEKTPFYLGSGAAFTVAIVGESYRQTALREISGGRRRRGEEVIFDAVVYAEPSNPYDPCAIRVEDGQGRHIGYLAKEDAAAYQSLFTALRAESRVGTCRAKLIGGTATKPSLGVILDLEEYSELTNRRAAEDQPF
jgi:hypothetical protein